MRPARIRANGPSPHPLPQAGEGHKVPVGTNPVRVGRLKRSAKALGTKRESFWMSLLFGWVCPFPSPACGRGWGEGLSICFFFFFIVLAAQAAPIVPWTSWLLGENIDVVTDTKGTKIKIAQAEGPQAGEKALKVTASLGEWGGVWVEAKTDWTTVRALTFKAKASAPGLIEVALIDTHKVRYVCKVRVVSDEWEEFTLPLTAFRPTEYPAPGVSKNTPLDLSAIHQVQLSPWTAGTTTYWVGPLSSALPNAKTFTGMPEVTVEKGELVVQDFLLLDKRSYGPFTDGREKTLSRMEVERDPEQKGSAVGVVQYEVDDKGWCGLWIRCGIDWGGQDWRGGNTLRLVYKSDDEIPLEIGFNDRNQNAYVTYANLKETGDEWRKVEVPLKAFRLNREYQPKEGRAGSPLDLSRIETFNVKPLLSGEHEFRLKEVVVLK